MLQIDSILRRDLSSQAEYNCFCLFASLSEALKRQNDPDFTGGKIQSQSSFLLLFFLHYLLL